MRRTKLLSILAMLLMAVTQGAWADENPAVSTELEEYIPLENMSSYSDGDPTEITWARYYRFNYETVDANNNPIVLSSALIAPRDVANTIETVYIYCHYTITANYEAPSQWTTISVSYPV